MPPRPLAIILFLFALFAHSGSFTCAESQKLSEYEVKAAYLYNFVKFVQWPSGAFQDGSNTIHLCLIGDDPFGAFLTSLDGKKVGERSIGVRRISSPRSVQACEVLFIAGTEGENLNQILKILNDTFVLTIGDSEGFAGKGVMVNLFMENNRVRFEINHKAALRAGIRISSNLLRIARIVGEP